MQFQSQILPGAELTQLSVDVRQDECQWVISSDQQTAAVLLSGQVLWSARKLNWTWRIPYFKNLDKVEEEVCCTPKPKEILTVQKQGRHSRGSSKPCSGILIPLWQFSFKIHHQSGSDFPRKLYSISIIHISSILPLPPHWGGDFAVAISQGHHLLHPKTVQQHC